MSSKIVPYHEGDREDDQYPIHVDLSKTKLRKAAVKRILGGKGDFVECIIKNPFPPRHQLHLEWYGVDVKTYEQARLLKKHGGVIKHKTVGPGVGRPC